MSASEPSSENRLVPGYFTWQKRSKPSALMTSSSMRRRVLASGRRRRRVSMCSSSQVRFAGESMCAVSTPMLAQ
jgi:hypothetical protein